MLKLMLIRGASQSRSENACSESLETSAKSMRQSAQDYRPIPGILSNPDRFWWLWISTVCSSIAKPRMSSSPQAITPHWTTTTKRSSLVFLTTTPTLAWFSPCLWNRPDGEEISIQTSDGQQRVYRRDARVSFEVDGESVTLAMYNTGQPGFFIPFRDSTSGKTSYGAGRYLDIEANGDGSVTLDFNLAYNPYCAYNDSYSCPMPPHENWLTIPIEAGEKDWPAHL